mmetsp:Transcript_31263/g.57209  ORF Transcript_31263/g.57209 Transcript_31263/m.57209 type:complete len:282 (+) Transcript_31263:720-1565(+)
MFLTSSACRIFLRSSDFKSAALSCLHLSPLVFFSVGTVGSPGTGTLFFLGTEVDDRNSASPFGRYTKASSISTRGDRPAPLRDRAGEMAPARGDNQSSQLLAGLAGACGLLPFGMALLALLGDMLGDLPGDICRDTSPSICGLAGLGATDPTACGNCHTHANGGGGVLEPPQVLRDPIEVVFTPSIHIRPPHSRGSTLLGSDGFNDGLESLLRLAQGLGTRAFPNRSSGSGHTPPVGILRCLSVGPGDTCRLCVLLCTATHPMLGASSLPRISDTRGLSVQ